MTDPISDMLTRIKNATKVRHEKVTAPYSNFKLEILKILKKEGYIESFKKVKNNKIEELEVILSYTNNTPRITELKKISRSSQRIYVDKKNIPQSKQGLGIMIVSTSKGLMTGKEARKQGVGGEVLCEVW